MKEDLEKLELMIKNNNEYEDIIEQSMQIDKYIKKKRKIYKIYNKQKIGYKNILAKIQIMDTNIP